MTASTLRRSIVLLVWLAPLVQPLRAQDTAPFRAASASEALQVLLDRNITPAAGPLTGDGATIAGVLAGQSLTFPMASSSGAFVSVNLAGFGPPIPVSTSGSFGPLFAERALTNGRNNLSLSINYQHKSWKSMAGIDLRGFALKGRSVFRHDVGGSPEGTAEEFAADIDFQTDVLVLAANYGVLRSMDVGISIPYVRSTVKGVKQRTRTIPGGDFSVRARQQVSGSSHGLGDAIVRTKYRIGWGNADSGSFWSEKLQLAAGYDLRLATGATARLSLDCSQPPCSGNHQDVPDVGLGKTTHKWSIFASSVLGRVSPHANVSYVLVPAYSCSRRFGTGGRCRGAVFEMDQINNIQDAKGQDLSNEWNVIGGFDYQMQPFRSTLSVDVIGRQLIRAGQFYEGPSRMVIRDSGTNPSDSVSTRIESRHGNINTVVGVIGAKVGFKQRWVLAANVLFPLNSAGLQPNATWVLGLERALTR